MVNYHSEVNQRIEGEIAWCEEHQLAPPPEEEWGNTFAPNADRELTEDIFTYLEGEELDAVIVMVNELSQRRELTLDPLPTIRLIDPDTYRRLSCWYMLNPDPSVESDEEEIDAWWQFERIVGYIEPTWTTEQLGHLSSLTTVAWYHELDGDAAVTMISSSPLPRDRLAALSHELVHAMQDRLLESGLMDSLEDLSTDQSTAARWVIEGDASLMQLAEDDEFLLELTESYDWGEPEQGPWELAGVNIAEVGIRGTLVYQPYIDGEEYVSSVWDESGSEGVNALLLDLPASSEQIRHADRLAKREAPLSTEPLLDLRNRVLGSDDDLPHDTLGEGRLATLIWFTTQHTARAAESAAGWGVDVFSATTDFDGDSEVVVLWQIAMDHPAAHARAVIGLREWLRNTSQFQAVSSVDDRHAAWDWERGSVRIVDHANLVWLVATESADVADLVTRRILALDEPREWWQPVANDS